ncbi:MAG: carbohydrate porin [Candidatus Acidoferrales bacterium]|nr:carbohydrate porin [Candidatus Acidoferrales bacterium]
MPARSPGSANPALVLPLQGFLAGCIGRILCALLVCVAAPHGANAQEPVQTNPQSTQTEPSAAPAPDADSDSSSTDTLTLFPHSDTSRYWISGQANIILQWHPGFPAKYTGTNSLRPEPENGTSKVYTLYLGYELTPTTEVFLDIESAGGHGLSNALGLAGITNLDVVRNTTLSQNPYVARLMLRQIIPLSDERIEADRDELHLATSLPARRIEFRAGKFDLADFFDLNTWGQDSHLQFLNWTVDNNGAYDYAANTRGYTDGVMIEYDDHWWTARFAEALMPKVANGIFLDADVSRARAENLELEARGKLIAHRAGTVRLLGYLNHANMGNYREAINEYLAGDKTSPPDITATRRQGRHKYGFGLNFEQEIVPDMGVFGRLGWSDGRNESFAYTEVDRTLELGGFTKGTLWHRRNDRAGVAFVANGIVAAHQQYLALGGLGFLLGDGGLTYGPEKIFEGFYTAHVWRGVFASFDIQHLNNPGYNQNRGPVTVPALRLHVDF